MSEDLPSYTSQETAPPAVPLPVNMPTNVRSVALALMAMVTVIAALWLGREVLIPITLAVALSYALMPSVNWLQRRVRVPLPLGAALVLTLLVTGVVFGANALKPQALQLLDSLPQATRNLEKLLNANAFDRDSAIGKAGVAAEALEKMANSAVTGERRAPPRTEAAITLDLREYVWAGTAATMRGLWQFIVIIALVYFLLISGHGFKRKLVKITGETLAQKKITVQILDEIDTQIQRYLVIQITTSALVGLLTGLAFAAIGLESAAFWGAAAGVLHLIPYVGPGLIVIVSSLFAFLQFDQLEKVLLVGGSALLIAGVIGLLLVPWLTEKVGHINVVATFIALLFWEWLWGIPGLLLGIPIMMAVMAVCERIDNLVPIAELLGQHEDRRPWRVEVRQAFLKKISGSEADPAPESNP